MWLRGLKMAPTVSFEIDVPLVHLVRDKTDPPSSAAAAEVTGDYYR